MSFYFRFIWTLLKQPFLLYLRTYHNFDFYCHPLLMKICQISNIVTALCLCFILFFYCNVLVYVRIVISFRYCYCHYRSYLMSLSWFIWSWAPYYRLCWLTTACALLHLNFNTVYWTYFTHCSNTNCHCFHPFATHSLQTAYSIHPTDLPLFTKSIGSICRIGIGGCCFNWRLTIYLVFIIFRDLIFYWLNCYLITFVLCLIFFVFTKRDYYFCYQTNL